MRKFVHAALLAGSGLSALLSGTAWGQEGAIGSAARESDTDTNAATDGDIIVTAQRREERLTDVPLSVSVIGGDFSRDLGAQSTRDISQLVPGIIMPSFGLAVQPAIRGISSTGTSAGDESNVATYIDDFYLGSSNEGVMDLADVERIEVLKGPQGTLFGRNATGGAIRVFTRKPQFKPEAVMTASYGFDFNEIKASAFATGPLSDTVAVSAAVNYVHDDGYVLNINTGNRSAYRRLFSIRGRVLFAPSDDFDVVLTGYRSRGNDTTAYALAPLDGNLLLYSNPAVQRPQTPQEISSIDPVYFLQNYGAQANAELRLPGVDIKSITGYRKSNARFGFDSDRTNLPVASGFLLTEQKIFSQELNFSSDWSGPFSATGGLYYYHSDATLNNASYPGDFTYTGSNSQPLDPKTLNFEGNVVTKSFAAFGEATIEISERLKLTGGLRYTNEKKTYNYRDIVRAAGLRSIVDDSRTFEKLTYRAVAQYNFTPDANIYASFNTGFKSGVYNANSFPVNLVEPENVDAYEIGAKARIRGMNFSLAAFHYDYTNIQVQAVEQINGINVVRLLNAATGKITGVDFNVSGRVSPGLQINAGLGWLPKADYDRFPTALVFVPIPGANGNTTVSPFDASGYRLIRSPKLTANLGATYETPLARGTLRISGNYSYNSGYHAFQTAYYRQSSYSLVNGNVGWTTPDEHFTFSLFAENLFNKRYGIYEVQNANGASRAWARPRLIGLKLQARL